MFELSFLFLGALATLTALGSFLGFDLPTRALLALFSGVLWIMWGFASFSVRSEYTGNVHAQTGLNWVGWIAGVLMFAFFIRMAFGLIKESKDSGSTDGLLSKR